AMLALVGRFGELTVHGDARVRADACHYLSLTRSAEARAYLTHCLQDEDDVVREIATESLLALGE
ncbi:MAG: HEAT repeat domain-containing protein, partial [Hydrogenophilaceae bacterium]